MKASAPEAREEKGYRLLGKQEQPLSNTWTGSPFLSLAILILLGFFRNKKRYRLRGHILVLNFSVPTVAQYVCVVLYVPACTQQANMHT